MSKFDEICTSYQRLVREAEDYEYDCKEFAKNLISGFVDYLECGRNDILIKRLSINDDGYYDCEIELSVYEGPDKYASRGLVPEIHLKIARNIDEFMVKVATGSKIYVINKKEMDSSEVINVLYDELFRGIKSYYETPIDEFIHRNMRGIIHFP
ncbi:MAG: hypothetical protein H7263_07140 [Candidatus Sericytochromatia bacterium]|nr:hypothetical protein [Candidatus Sericytochromatia bacterium]